jgi:hypothetical protein
MDGKSTHGVHLQNMPSSQETVETLWLDCRNPPHAPIPRMVSKEPEVIVWLMMSCGMPRNCKYLKSKREK